MAVAERLYETFWAANPALSSYKEQCERDARSGGWIVGLDGRRLNVRSPHSAVNMSFQSAGSIVVKMATVKHVLDRQTGSRELHEQFNQYTRKFFDGELDYWMVLHYHDEIEIEVKPGLIEQWVSDVGEDFIAAGEHFNFNVPTPGDPKVAMNWAEVH